jgi:hypothetical protein
VHESASCCQTQYITDNQPITQQKELVGKIASLNGENMLLIMNLFAISTASIKVVSSFIIAAAMHS